MIMYIPIGMWFPDLKWYDQGYGKYLFVVCEVDLAQYDIYLVELSMMTKM